MSQNLDISSNLLQHISSVNMSAQIPMLMSRVKSLVYTVVRGDEVTDEQLRACSAVFSENYSTWSIKASPPLKPGKLTFTYFPPLQAD